MKLQSNELRLGNLVFNTAYNPQDGYAIGYKPIEKATIQTIQFPSFYEPIPLTEELLVKFGFTLYGTINLQGGGSLQIMKQTGALIWVNEADSIEICKIKYVHQLQNLYFALTGEELNYSVNP